MQQGFYVPPRSTESIAQIAHAIRINCKIDDHSYFPIVELIENIFVDGFEVASIEEMGSNEGLTYPDLEIIKIREDVYENAVAGDGRARFTLAHELGHYVLHRNISLARTKEVRVLKPYENSEWQADEFAGQILAPKHIIEGFKTATEISKSCGISLKAAQVRMSKIKYR